jgi:arsenate reductase
LRFFAERRVKTHFVDFAVRGPAPAEIRRFAERFGPSALVDRTAPRFAELGLRAAQPSEDRWLDLLVAEPLLIRMPLVRFGNRLSVGPDEAAWRSWLV